METAVYPPTHSEKEALQKQVEALREQLRSAREICPQKTLAQLGSEAYYESLNPDSLPPIWAHQPPVIQRAWEATAQAIINAL